MRSKKKLIAAASSVCFAAMMSLTAYASGDVAGAVTSTWGAAKSQVVSVVNNVVFPVIDVILAVLLFVKITLAYLDYRNRSPFYLSVLAVVHIHRTYLHKQQYRKDNIKARKNNIVHHRHYLRSGCVPSACDCSRNIA